MDVGSLLPPYRYETDLIGLGDKHMLSHLARAHVFFFFFLIHVLSSWGLREFK